MKFLSSSLLAKGDRVKTSSRLWKWWLTTREGYTVEQVIEHPKRYMLGRLTYSKTWILKPPRQS